MKIWNINQDNKCNPIHHTLVGAFRDLLDEYADEGANGVKIPNPKNIPVQKARIFDDKFGLVIEFSERDFINKSSYRGAQKLYKANSQKPKYSKKYCGKNVGMVHMIGFKITDYDFSYNVLVINNNRDVGMKFIDEVLVPKMRTEFPAFPDRMYEDDYSLEEYIDNRGWLRIGNLSPQEKIVLANVHQVEPFPESLYENDYGDFNKRVYALELKNACNLEINDQYELDIWEEIKDIKDKDEAHTEYEKLEQEYKEQNDLAREDFYQSVADGWDYGSWEMSDLYTRVDSQVIDYELYPIRTNCTPKAIRKRGKSPYDTKLGVREHRYFNYYQRAKPLDSWKKLETVDKIPSKASPKYHWEMNEEEIMTDEYDLPSSFWEDIEMAYQMR
jgi:hypothetical protein